MEIFETWTQSSTPRTPGNPATLWNSWKDCSLLEASLHGEKVAYYTFSSYSLTVLALSKFYVLKYMCKCNKCQSRPVKGDKLRGFLHQSSGHIGHTSGHGCLADPNGVSHGRLEWPRCIEAQSRQHLNLCTDGSGPLGAPAERLSHIDNIKYPQFI